jgi:uncharacterized protein DUF397
MSAQVWRKSSFSTANSNCVEVTWRKSSYSGANSDCVEVSWRKSSFSTANSECVEVAVTPELVAARDSKNASGPVLTFASAHWSAFLRTYSSR